MEKSITIPNITIKALINKYSPRKTYTKNNNFFCICPFPGHKELTPSFLFKLDNTFYCFGCHKRGEGAIDFIKTLFNISEKEAIAKIRADFGEKDN